MLRADKVSPKLDSSNDPTRPKTLPLSKVYAAQSPNRRIWLRDFLVAAGLAVLYYLLASHLTPPSDSPLSRAGSTVLTLARTSRSVSLTNNGATAKEPSVVDIRNLSRSRGRNETRPTQMERRVGAVIGLFVADAAAMGLHW
jgi:hypothetical protein